MMQDDQKERVGKAAAELVRPDMTIGLGTGSTAAFFIKALAEKDLKPRCVATSEATAALAASLGLHVVGLENIKTVIKS